MRALVEAYVASRQLGEIEPNQLGKVQPKQPSSVNLDANGAYVSIEPFYVACVHAV